MLILHSYQSQSLGQRARLAAQLRRIDSSIIDVEVATLYFLIPSASPDAKAQPSLSDVYGCMDIGRVAKLLNIADAEQQLAAAASSAAVVIVCA